GQPAWQAAEEAAGAAADATAPADRLAQALDTLHQGVVLCDEDGSVRYRNRLAEGFAGARHAEALAEQAINEALSAALDGEEHVPAVDLYGPPRPPPQTRAAPPLPAAP